MRFEEYVEFDGLGLAALVPLRSHSIDGMPGGGSGSNAQFQQLLHFVTNLTGSVPFLGCEDVNATGFRWRRAVVPHSDAVASAQRLAAGVTWATSAFTAALVVAGLRKLARLVF